MEGSESRELTFHRVTVLEDEAGLMLVGEGADETETLFAHSLSVHGWELSLEGSMTLHADAGSDLRVKLTDGHADLRD